MASHSSSSADWMYRSFLKVQEKLELNLRDASDSISHPGTQGTVNENHWIEVFQAYLPNRYAVSSGIVIDSRGQRSDQIDIVIFDLHFTPTLIDQQQHRYIPAEAVYAVFEAKPDFQSNLKYAGQKAASVRQLLRTSVDVVHVSGKTPAREPKPIIAGIVAADASWKDGLGKSFKKNLPTEPNADLDCGCALMKGAFDFHDGALQVAKREGALMFFLFRLLRKLQSMGSVTAIDWAAYTEILSQGG